VWLEWVQVLWALGLPLAGPGGAAYRAFGFLAAAAPCALLMTPLAYVAAIGYCAQRGVLVRGPWGLPLSLSLSLSLSLCS
jgi:cation transport ATPase